MYGEELTQAIASTKGNWRVIPIPITNLIQQKYATPSPFVSNLSPTFHMCQYCSTTKIM
jgi:hypothetical protein